MFNDRGKRERLIPWTGRNGTGAWEERKKCSRLSEGSRVFITHYGKEYGLVSEWRERECIQLDHESCRGTYPYWGLTVLEWGRCHGGGAFKVAGADKGRENRVRTGGDSKIKERVFSVRKERVRNEGLALVGGKSKQENEKYIPFERKNQIFASLLL